MLAAIAACAGSAHADTMYKCTDPNGKVSYSDQPCTGQSKARTLDVIAPKSTKAEPGETAQIREKPETELQRLRRADAAFRERLAESDRAAMRERMRVAQASASQRESEGRKRRQQELEDAEDERQAMFERMRNQRDRNR